MHRELNVRSAGLHADGADDALRFIAHRLVLVIRERLLRRDGDRVAGVHAHRIEVLDRADDDDVVRLVAHHLELELFPAADRLLDQNAVHRRELDSVRSGRPQFFDVVRNSPTRPAQRERRADHQRIADAHRDLLRFVDGAGITRARHLDADSEHAVFEQLAVFGRLDRVVIRADQFDAVLLQNSGFPQRAGEVDPCLAANGGQEGVRLFAFDDLLERFRSQRLDVRSIGELRIGHDRRRIRVDEDDAIAFLFEGLAGLRAGVVELARLTDDDGTGADDQNRMEIGSLRHEPAG